MTLDIDALAALEARSHPAPWRFVNNVAGDTAVLISDGVIAGGAAIGRMCNCDSGPCRDASLISALRNAAPALFAVVRHALIVAAKGEHAPSCDLNNKAPTKARVCDCGFGDLREALEVFR